MIGSTVQPEQKGTGRTESCKQNRKVQANGKLQPEQKGAGAMAGSSTVYMPYACVLSFCSTRNFINALGSSRLNVVVSPNNMP